MRDEVAFLILQNINKGLKTQKYIINEYVLYSEFAVRDLEAVCVCLCRDSGILFEYAGQGTAVISHSIPAHFSSSALSNFAILRPCFRTVAFNFLISSSSSSTLMPSGNTLPPAAGVEAGVPFEI
jgi:hypothetical protein